MLDFSEKAGKFPDNSCEILGVSTDLPYQVCALGLLHHLAKDGGINNQAGYLFSDADAELSLPMQSSVKRSTSPTMVLSFSTVRGGSSTST